MNGADTMNLGRLETEFLNTGFDALVAASQESVLYFSGVPIRSVLGWERITAVVWPREGAPSLVVCDIDQSLAEAESRIDDVRAYVEFSESPVETVAAVLREKGLAEKHIGLQMEFLTAAQCEELAALLPKARLEACDRLLDSVWATKTEKEIVLLTEAFNVAEKAIHAGFSKAEVGMTGTEVLEAIDAHAAARGAERGPSTLRTGDSPPTGDARHKKMEPGDLVRVDFVGRYRGYIHDIARTAVVGKPTTRQRDTYRRFWTVQRKVINSMAPGVRLCDVYWRGFQAFQEEGLPMWWVIPHMGHSVGVGLHEHPMIQPYDDRVLEPNMTFCVEPIYPDPGIGTYLCEDLVRITETGSEVLSDLFDTSELFVIGGRDT